jgi:enoyl-[acyl-carrier protein] reductase II
LWQLSRARGVASKEQEREKVIRTAICDFLDIRYPIIQGGMAYLGTWELASAVSNAGGLGIIGAGDAPADWVQEQIHHTKERTNKPFGVNIMLMSPYVEQVVEVVLAERVPVIATGGGNPGIYISRFKQIGSKLMPVVSTVALAKRLERLGVDAVVAEGVESGGHVGETSTMALIPQVVNSVKIPVVAAGGIGDGRGLAAALALGAQGVQLGTRFICAEECIAHPDFKRKLIEVGDRATIVTGESSGHPARALKNKMTRQFSAMEKSGISKEELEQFGKGKLRLGIIDGDLNDGSLMCGQIAGLITEIKPAKDIIEEIVAEAEARIAALSSLLYGGNHEQIGRKA